MNIRKPIDYSAMFTALDTLMAADLPQMELYCEIGRLVSGRRSKGAAGWTQNVVILEPELTPQERAWYIKAAGQFGWSKLELQRRITDRAHLEILLDFTEKVCYTEAKNDITECASNDKDPLYLPRQNTGTIAETIEMTVLFAVWFTNLRHAYANAPNMVKGSMQ